MSPILKMTKGVFIALTAATSYLFSAAALADTRVYDAGSAQITTVHDRWSGQTAFRLSYQGYLTECRELAQGRWTRKDINVYFIRHSNHGTKMLTRKIGISCHAAHYAPHARQSATFYSSGDYTKDWELMDFLKVTSSGMAPVELAFESNGHWDSNFGANFKPVLKAEF